MFVVIITILLILSPTQIPGITEENQYLKKVVFKEKAICKYMLLSILLILQSI